MTYPRLLNWLLNQQMPPFYVFNLQFCKIILRYGEKELSTYVVYLSGFFGADCKNLGLGQATPPSTSSGTPETGTKEHQDGTKGPIIFANS